MSKIRRRKLPYYTTKSKTLVLFSALAGIVVIGTGRRSKSIVIQQSTRNETSYSDFLRKVPKEPPHMIQILIGVGPPKAGSNKLDSMIVEAFGAIPCYNTWVNFKRGTAHDAIYCSHGKTIADRNVQKDTIDRFTAKECNYLGTHQDYTIRIPLERHFTNVHYATILRDPIGRLVSACNYSLGKECNWESIVKLAKEGRGYGMPDRMTKMIAGLDPVCGLEPKSTRQAYEQNRTALLARAKDHLRNKFSYFAILERLEDSLRLLKHISSSNQTLSKKQVLPYQASAGGSFQGEPQRLQEVLGPYVELDYELYQYANDLLTERLEHLEMQPLYTFAS